ncbi:MAG: hypothetical protein HS103_06090 [Anaerolineales bacterium]|nr:hypothetical protein [Anaerolineales bacterium]
MNAGAWLSTYWGTFTLGRVLSIGVAQVLSTTTLLRGAMISVIGGALLFVWSPSPEVGLAGVVLIGLFTAPSFRHSSPTLEIAWGTAMLLTRLVFRWQQRA